MPRPPSAALSAAREKIAELNTQIESLLIAMRNRGEALQARDKEIALYHKIIEWMLTHAQSQPAPKQ